jgi:hypothetical protein
VGWGIMTAGGGCSSGPTSGLRGGGEGACGGGHLRRPGALQVAATRRARSRLGLGRAGHSRCGRWSSTWQPI